MHNYNYVNTLWFGTVSFDSCSRFMLCLYCFVYYVYDNPTYEVANKLIWHQIGLSVFRFVDCTISVVPFPPLSPPGVGSYGWVLSPTRGAPTPSIAPGRDGWPRIPNIFDTDDRRAPRSQVQRLNNVVNHGGRINPHYM